MNRRAIILVVIIVLMLAGVGMYFYAQKHPSTPQSDTPSFGEGGLPVSTTETQDLSDTPEDQGGTTDPGRPQPRLYELHKTPVGGVAFFESGKGALLSFAARYIERGLGHIYETPLETLSEARISGETHTRISEALWGNKGASIIIRSFDESDQAIKTRILNISAPEKVAEVLLPDHIPFMATADDNSDKIFYLENGYTASRGTTASFKNTGARQVFSSTITEWLPQFPNKNLVTLTTRPSGAVVGHLFFVDPTTKTMTKILGGVNGLTTLTKGDGKLVLYAETRERLPKLFVYDTTKKESLDTGLQTLPEKCVWSKKSAAIAYCAVPRSITPAMYPDQWYQGIISFSDDLWSIDVKTLEVKKVLMPSTEKATSLDMTNLVVSSNDEYLLFVNKITGTPWMYRFAETAPMLKSATATQTSTQAVIPVSTAQTQEGMTRIK